MTVKPTICVKIGHNLEISKSNPFITVTAKALLTFTMTPQVACAKSDLVIRKHNLSVLFLGQFPSDQDEI